MKRLLIGLLAAAIFGGCKSTPPTHYFTLNMEPSGTAGPALNILVERVEVGEALSRRDIMIKEGPTQIEYYATSQWVAGLDELVRHKLQEEFGLPQEGKAVVSLIATVLAFEQIDTPGGADARVKLAVEIRDGNTSRHDPPRLSRIYEAKKKAATERPADVVQALSELTETIAGQITADVAALPQG